MSSIAPKAFDYGALHRELEDRQTERLLALYQQITQAQRMATDPEQALLLRHALDTLAVYCRVHNGARRASGSST